jgi:hypothetical protein
MTPELEEKLYAKYPKILVENAGFYGRGCPLGIGDGWYYLLDTLCRHLQWLTDKKDMPQVTATQIKEKFGGLRFYIGGASDIQHELISFTESLSYHICEQCGNPGEKRMGGWIKVLCDVCLEKGREL